MKVYAVVFADWETHDIYGIYLHEKDAEARMLHEEELILKTNPGLVDSHMDIEEYEVQE